MPGKMPRSDPRPSVGVIRGAGSGQHLASVLQEGRETRTLMPVWDSSGEFSKGRLAVLKDARHTSGTVAPVGARIRAWRAT
jgi:hypothetical protein